MKQVNAALPLRGGVLLTQLIGSRKNVVPFNRSMNQQTVTDIFIDLAKSSATAGNGHLLPRNSVAQSIPHFEAMQGSEANREALLADKRAAELMMFICAMERNQE